ncbi:alpha-amylase family protein [Pelomyxa schiedti]|nr:alpha-amylase family protein [Pelomyxa schiedti]
MTDDGGCSLVYHVLPDRFRVRSGSFCPDFCGTDYYGGSVRGVVEALGYIKSMGFQVIFLGPFLQNADYHGYHILDYERVDRRLFGLDSLEPDSLEALQELRDACTKWGMKIMLDFVPNHIYKDHPWVSDGEHNDWFFRNSEGVPRRFFLNFPHLIKVNLDNPAAQNYMINLALRLQKYVDIFRVDHALGCSRHFLSALTKALHHRNSTTKVIGEFWVDLSLRDSKYLVDTFDSLTLEEKETLGDMLEKKDTSIQNWLQLTIAEKCCSGTPLVDGVLDFEAHTIIKKYCRRRSVNIPALQGALSKHFEQFPSFFLLPVFMDNHDTDRILYSCQGNFNTVLQLTKCLLQITQRYNQPFIVYYGTEAGMTHHSSVHSTPYGDNQARQPFPWGRPESTNKIIQFCAAMNHGTDFDTQAVIQHYECLPPAPVIAVQQQPTQPDCCSLCSERSGASNFVGNQVLYYVTILRKYL